MSDLELLKTDQFTEEQIKKYQIITKEQAEKDIEVFLYEKKILEERVESIPHVRNDSIFIERIDYRERGFGILNDEDKKEGRMMQSCYGRVLSISPVKCHSNEDINEMKKQYQIGDYVNYNHEAPYSLNLLDWKYKGKYDKLFKSIWVVAVDNILGKDEDQKKYGDYHLAFINKIKNIQRQSVEKALYQIEEDKKPKEDHSQSMSETLRELRTDILDDSKKTNLRFKGLPTPKFHYREGEK